MTEAEHASRRRPILGPQAGTIVCAALASLGVLAVVPWTVAPGLTFGDSGDLLSAAETLGLAHAPGYPLWCMTAHLAMRLLPLSHEGAANMLSALSLSVAGLLAFLAFQRLARAPVLALVGAWALCLTPAVWSQAVIAEVYTFDLALVMLEIWLLIRAYDRVASGEALRSRDALLLGLAFGAGASHRPSHGLHLIALPLTLRGLERGRWRSARLVALFVLGWLMGLSVWLYLPIRSGLWPSLSGQAGYVWWAPIRTLDAFIGTIAGRQYQGVFYGARLPLWGTVLRFDLGYLARELSPAAWLSAAIGLLGLRRAGRRAWPMVLVGATTLALFWNYTVYDQELFFIPFYAGVCGLAVLGMAEVRARWGPRACAAWVLVMLAWAAARAPGTFRACDRSGDRLADAYVAEVESSMRMPRAQLVFLASDRAGDHRILPLVYGRTSRGLLTRVWWHPGRDAATWDEFIRAMGVPEDAASGLRAAPPAERDRAALWLMADYPPAFVAGTRWGDVQGLFSAYRGWFTPVLTHRPEREGTPPVDYGLAWAQQCLPFAAEDRTVRIMAFVPALEWANEMETRGEPAGAAMLLEEAARVDPRNPELLAQLGAVLARSGRADEGLGRLTEAQDACDDLVSYLHVRRELASALIAAGRREEAAAVFGELLEMRTAASVRRAIEQSRASDLSTSDTP